MARVIKRYENRKLYDTERSRYVSLRDIAEMVRKGETVQVIDNVTGEDITAQTLTQIIMEEGRAGRFVLPVDFLHELLRRGSSLLDTGWHQLREGVDEWLQEPLHRLQRLLGVPEEQKTLKELRERLEQLEAKIDRLLQQQTTDSVKHHVSSPKPKQNRR